VNERSQNNFFFNFIFFPFWQKIGSAGSEKRKINEQWPYSFNLVSYSILPIETSHSKECLDINQFQPPMVIGDQGMVKARFILQKQGWFVFLIGLARQ